MLRKHPDVLALLVIVFAVFTSIGINRAVEVFERESGFRVRPIVVRGDGGSSQRRDSVRESILVLKDTLKSLRP